MIRFPNLGMLFKAQAQARAIAPNDDAEPTQPLKPKIFGIGLPKTGTTTLQACFSFFGRKQCAPFMIDALQHYVADDLDSIGYIANQYDVFRDGPWFALYREMALRYPDAKFILTRRSSADAWEKSALAHAKRKPYTHDNLWRQLFAKYLPGVLFEAMHDSHLAMVRSFFADQPQRLLEVCWEEDASWSALCSFLEAPIPSLAFPHENKGLYFDE